MRLLTRVYGTLRRALIPRTRTVRSNNGHAYSFAEAPCFLAPQRWSSSAYCSRREHLSASRSMLGPHRPKRKKMSPRHYSLDWTRHICANNQSKLAMQDKWFYNLCAWYLLGMCSKQFNKLANIQTLAGLKVLLYILSHIQLFVWVTGLASSLDSKPFCPHAARRVWGPDYLTCKSHSIVRLIQANIPT